MEWGWGSCIIVCPGGGEGQIHEKHVLVGVKLYVPGGGGGKDNVLGDI